MAELIWVMLIVIGTALTCIAHVGGQTEEVMDGDAAQGNSGQTGSEWPVRGTVLNPVDEWIVDSRLSSV